MDLRNDHQRLFKPLGEKLVGNCVQWMDQPDNTGTSNQSYHHERKIIRYHVLPDIMQKKCTIIYKVFFQKKLHSSLIKPLDLTTSSQEPEDKETC